MDWQRKKRRAALVSGLAFSLAFSVSAASAFTQEPVQAPQPGTQNQAPAQNLQPQVTQPQLQPQGVPGAPQGYFVQPFSTNNVNGTEINIPGVGSVGSLPKLDFGLELLYSPQSNNFQSPQFDQRTPDNDVQIKGTLKHKF